ncbi:hypothetical protein ABPG75_000672 [Micractinium tetrahymenae]
MAGGEQKEHALWLRVAITYGYVLLWIALSAAVILYNKWVLAFSGFPYPVALTMWHMFFCAALAWVIIRLGYVEPVKMGLDTYLRTIVPIGFLYAGTLWLGNAAYLYLSVSFIQMLKATMPVAVFTVGCLFGTEHYTSSRLLNMIVVTIGVAIASYGEINFVVIGVVLQMASVATESTRLTLVQILLQRRGIKLNPITTLYLIAPCCFAFLCIPFFFLELPKMLNDPSVKADPLVFLSNAGAAFGLNMAVFLLIGKTSALTMNIAGVVKDWILILLSYLIYKAPVTALNLEGYGLAFLAVCWYNFQKLRSMQASKPPASAAPEKGGRDEEATRLLAEAGASGSSSSVQAGSNPMSPTRNASGSRLA